MGTAPNAGGLKGQWGVSDPQGAANDGDAGSDKQGQAFQAAFQKEHGITNGHLQYTAANAEASAHAGFAARRDALYAAFQGAAAKIDRKDPSKAQGHIDKVLADARALSGEVAAFRQAAERAKKDWDALQGKYDAAVHRIEELEAWEDKQASALRGQADKIRTQVNVRRYAEAITALDGMVGQLAPVYEEYVRQRNAKAKYEPGRDALEPRATKACTSNRARLQAERDTVGTARDAMGTSALDKNYVQALEQLGDLAKKVEAFEAALEHLERKKKAFETARAALQLKLTQVEQSSFKKLEPKQQAIAAGKASIDSSAETEDYDHTMTLVSDLSAQCNEYQAAVAELEQQRKAYRAAWAKLQSRFEKTAQSQFKKLEPMQQDLAAIKTDIDSAVEAEDFARALTRVNDLSPKVDTFLADQEKARRQRQAYDDAWAPVGPKFSEAVQSEGVKLAPQRDQLTALRQQGESALAAEDFEQALTLTTDLGKKVNAYLQALKVLEQQKQRYEQARSPVQTELDKVLKANSRSLQPMRDEMALAKAEMEAAAAAQEYEKALQWTETLKSRIAAYKQELAKEQKEYEQQRVHVEAGIQKVSSSRFTQLEAKKAAIMSTYQAMIQLAAGQDYREAIAAGRTLEVSVSDFFAEAKSLRESIKANIRAGIPRIEAELTELEEDRSEKMREIKSLLASVKAAMGSDDDAALGKAAHDLDELSRLVGEVKNDPCSKARRSPEYKVALEDLDIAIKESASKALVMRNAKELKAAKYGKSLGTGDPVEMAKVQRDIDEAVANHDVAIAKELKAENARRAILKKYGCNDLSK